MAKKPKGDAEKAERLVKDWNLGFAPGAYVTVSYSGKPIKTQTSFA